MVLTARSASAGFYIKAFSKPALLIIDGEAFVNIGQFFFDHEGVAVLCNDLIIFMLLIQSNAEYGTTSAIAIDDDANSFFVLYGGL